MKRFWICLKSAYKIYQSDQFFVCTTKNKWFETDSDMEVDVLRFIVDDTIDVSVGEHTALKQAKELLKIK